MMLPWLEETRRGLANRIAGERLGHAPLIHGPRGIGKRALGEWLARLLLCNQPQGGQPCGHCQSCRLIDGGTHPDLFVVELAEDKQSIGVDQIRRLIERLQLTASLGASRIGLVPNADAMNRNAANALLKTLEEPPSGAWLILLSEQPSRLPATVRSRCQQWPLRPADQDMAAQWLEQQCAGAEASERKAALELSGGAPLAARKMIESDDLNFGFQLLDDLSEARPHAQVLERWQTNPTATWRWLARWLAIVMAQASGAGGWKPPGRTLPRHVDQRRLAELWHGALEGRREAERGVVRQDLLLGQWLLEWRAAQPARK